MAESIVETTLETLLLGHAPEEEDSDAYFIWLLVNQFFDLLKSSIKRALSSQATLEFARPMLENQITFISSLGRMDQAKNFTSLLGHLESMLKDLEGLRIANPKAQARELIDRFLTKQRFKQ